MPAKQPERQGVSIMSSLFAIAGRARKCELCRTVSISCTLLQKMRSANAAGLRGGWTTISSKSHTAPKPIVSSRQTGIA
eukprot:6647689-Prymnesium_polylepis.3